MADKTFKEKLVAFEKVFINNETFKKEFQEFLTNEAKPREYPFKHRWKLDDSEFVLQRKSYWPYIKRHLEKEGLSKPAEIKQQKAFFLEGARIKNEWNAQYAPDVKRILSWTPCNNLEEMREIIDWLLRKANYDCGLTVLMLTSIALRGTTLCIQDSPVSFALNNDHFVRQIVFGDVYREVYFERNGKQIAMISDPKEIVKDFELSAYHNLMSSEPSLRSQLIHNINFYISCIRHLEKQGRFELDRSKSGTLKDFSALISAVFHFVEPGQTADKPPSAMADLAARLREMFLRVDAPEYIRREMAKMGESRLIEHRLEKGSTEQVFIMTFPVERGTPYGGSGSNRVLRGVKHSYALKAFSEAWVENGLLPQDFTPPTPELVDLGIIFTKQMCQELGYEKGQTVPAWKLTVWYTPDFQFSNSAQARFGCDLYFIISLPGVAGDGTATVLHHPKVSEFYLDYFPSNVVYLKERQLRRAILEKTGKHLVRYRDGYCPELDENYDDSARLNTGYDIFLDEEIEFTRVSVEGLPVKKLEGKDVVVPSWQEIINNVV